MNWPLAFLATGVLLTVFLPPVGIPLVLASLVVFVVRLFIKRNRNVTNEP